MKDKLSLDDFDTSTYEGREKLNKYMKERMDKHIKGILKSGSSIAYTDDSVEEDEIIIEYPDGTKKVFKYIDGKEKFIKNL